MANTTESAEGAQPLATPDTASWSLSTAQPVGETLHYPGDVPLPPGDGDASRTLHADADLSSGADRASPPSPNGSTVDELIATLPARVVEALSSKDIEALASGDPQAVARILLPDPPDGNENGPLSPAAAAAPAAAHAQAESGPERISLRGLAPQDRIALADLVRAVKEGRFASLDEARTAMQPTQAAPAIAREIPAAQMLPPEPALAHAQQRLAHLKSLQKEAADAYDTATLLHLNGEMARANQTLRQAQAAYQSHQHQLQHQSQNWAQEEARHLASVQQQLAAELAEEGFAKALREERDMAEFRADPVLSAPDWSLRLAERARQRLPQAVAGARPQARARGMVAAPSARGAAALSLDEAFEQIEGMSEPQVDAVLSQMRERERASRFTRAA
jgi:hypothetical protein